MENPFSFSSFAISPAFCNRHEEQSELKGFILNSQNILLHSHRRFGKSSLILKVFKELKAVTPIYVDLYGTTSIGDFIKALFKGLSSIETKLDRLMNLIKENINRLSVSFSIDQMTGYPIATPGFIPFDNSPVIDEVFSLIESLSRKKKLVIAFDEFQEVSKYNDSSFEKLLRKHIQPHHRVSYIFAGSQKHLLLEMFTDSKRAFYKQAAGFPLRKIEKSDYITWVDGLFFKAGKSFEPKLIDILIEKCECHPMYIQEFLYHLWMLESISIEDIEKTEQKILINRNAEFIAMWDGLTLNQKKTIKLLITTGGNNVFASNNIVKVGLKSASLVKKALDTLTKKDLVNKNGIYEIQDIMFKQWIVQKYIR